MNSTAVLPATLAPDAPWGQPSRLRVQRSNAYGLLANRADEDEIRAAIDDRLAADLGDALVGIMAETEPASDDELSAGVGSVVGLIGQDWSKGAQAEFITLAVNELSQFPRGLVIDALKRARQRVTAGRLLVAWICDDIEQAHARLKLEGERLTRLAEMAAEAK